MYTVYIHTYIHTYIHNPQTLLIAGLDKTQFDLLKFEFADWNAHCPRNELLCQLLGGHR